MQKKNTAKKKPVKYYGKKTYIVNPLLIKIRQPKDQQPDFSNENIDKKKRD